MHNETNCADTETDTAHLTIDFPEPIFSAADRLAIREAAEARRRAAMRKEAIALRNDPDDHASALELTAEMAELSVW